jgi:hypothetical protein
MAAMNGRLLRDSRERRLRAEHYRTAFCWITMPGSKSPSPGALGLRPDHALRAGRAESLMRHRRETSAGKGDRNISE